MRISFNPDKCTGCKMCEIVCTAVHEGNINPKNSRLKIVARYRSDGMSLEGRVCDGCGKCVDVCPPKALSLDGEYIHFHREKCTGCGLCLDACPKKAVAYGDDYKPRICDLCRGAAECVKWCPREAIVLEAS